MAVYTVKNKLIQSKSVLKVPNQGTSQRSYREHVGILQESYRKMITKCNGILSCKNVQICGVWDPGVFLKDFSRIYCKWVFIHVSLCTHNSSKINAIQISQIMFSKLTLRSRMIHRNWNASELHDHYNYFSVFIFIFTFKIGRNVFLRFILINIILPFIFISLTSKPLSQYQK